MRKSSLPAISPFEPDQVVAQADALKIPAPEVFAEPKDPPKALIIDEAIGFMDNGSLCMFREEQLVTNAADIRRLLQHGAKYMEVKLS